jgi:16S rRNA (cytosine1402-N4)-methyltransferase
MKMEFKHYSVLLQECIDNLNIKPDGIYLDGTLGGGGHSFHIAEKLSDEGHLYGVDQDADAIAAASKKLEEFGNRITVIRDNYENAVTRLKELGVTGVDGILLDLGVSSFQLDNADRGFTYKEDVPLDMRMDQRMQLTARDIVNDYSETEIFHIIRDFGEDKFAKNIAKHICMERAKAPIETTGQLNDIIKAAIPARMREKGGHPSKRTYQAIRIALNRELDVLQNSLDGFIDFLNPGGRLCVITFHSLEDRITKNNFKTNEDPCICPPEFPVCTCGRKSKGKVITRKPILPSEEELSQNKRSQSAKLRVFEKS